MKRTTAMTVAALLLLTGCDPDVEPVDPAPTQTVDPAPVTVTETPEPEVVTETVTVEAEPKPIEEEFDLSDEDMEEVQIMALDLIWSDMPQSDRDDICLGWSWDDDMMLEAFMDGAEGSFSESLVRDYFDGKCQ